MRRHTVGIVAVTMLVGSSATSMLAGPAMKRNIVGVIASVERHSPPTLQIKTSGGMVQEIRTDAKTQYVKWMTQKEGPHGPSPDADALAAGMCVEVEPRTGDPHSAKIVRVSEAPAGSNLDPCKNRR